MTTTPEAYVHLSTDETTLTFYYDTLRANRDGTTWGITDTRDYYGTPAWAAYLVSPNTTILTVVFDASFRDVRPTTTARWFYWLKLLKSIEGLEHLNTSQVTDMGGMFLGCESLTTIYCNTSWSASHSDDMFSGCNSLRGAVTNVGNSYDVSMANPETGYFTKKVLS